MNSYENKYTKEDLSAMKSWPLERKIQITQTRIIEWYQKNDGNVYVSFSGGKDSTVLLDLTRRIYPEIPAMFIDTGLEFPEIRSFIKTIQNVTWVRPKMSFRKVIETYGYPIISKEVAKRVYWSREYLARGDVGKWAYDSMTTPSYMKNGKRSMYDKTKWGGVIDAPFKVSDRCCYVMKKDTAHTYERETGRKPIIATMTEESQLRKVAWLRYGCNSFNSKHPSSKPMSFWTEQDVLEYILKFNIQYAPIYGEILRDNKGHLHTTGCKRTGCIYCGFGCTSEKEPNRFQRLQTTHPKLWEYCMKPWDEGGLGMKEVLEYIDVKIE